MGVHLQRWLRGIADGLTYALVRSLVAGVQVVSVERGARGVEGLAWLLSRLPLRRKIVDSNLQRVFPFLDSRQLREFRRAMWRNLLLMVCEIAWAHRRIHRTNWKQFVHIPNKPSILRPMLSNRPCVIVTGHYGNFEVGGYITGLFGLPTLTIARPMDNPYIDRWISRFRTSKGQQLVSKDGSAQIVNDHLQRGGTLSLLADQHAGHKGCWADFLGHPASCHKSLALFTLLAGAPMLVVASRRLSEPFQFELDSFGIADPRESGEHLQGVRQLTIWYNRRLAEAIARSPEQYWWLHRRWRDPPPPRQSNTARAA